MSSFNIKISQQSETSSSKAYLVSGDGSDIVLQRTIYNNLKSLVKNTNVAVLNGGGSSYDQFILDMCALHDKNILGTDVDVPVGTDEVNTYLGLLGESEDYPMKKDIIQLNKFLNADYTEIIWTD